MFNLTGSEIVVILLLALVILGPDKLPDAMRKAGRTWAELKKLSNGFQDEMRKGFEEPATEVKKTATAVKKAASFANAPVKNVQKSAKGAVKSLLDPPKPPTVDTTATEQPAEEPADVVEAADVVDAADVVEEADVVEAAAVAGEAPAPTSVDEAGTNP